MTRITLSLSLFLILLVTAAGAQEFTFRTDTLIENTHGKTPPNGSGWDNYTINMYNYALNETQAPLLIQWQILEQNYPNGWATYGFCDNATCRSEGSAAITSAAVQSSLPIPVGDSCLLEPRVKVPVEAANGTGIIRVRVFTNSQADTITYIINKTATGINTIALNDTRVMLYPNPATEELSVYTDKSLNAAYADVYSIGGARMAHYPVAGREVTVLNTNTLATGLYLVKILDNNGAVLTTRTFGRK